MENGKIKAILVNGFLDSGKTTYIQDCLKNDYFYKRGKTLLAVFEEGEEEYDSALLESRATTAVYWDGETDPEAFLKDAISTTRPDRVYVEMNAMRSGLYEALSQLLRIDFVLTLIDGSMLPLYYNNMRQLLQNMITVTHQVIFKNCEKESLTSYGNLFRVMNPKASYLWEAKEGYHDKAFGVMVPFDLNSRELTISEEDYTPFYLDSLAAPEHYAGKELQLVCQIYPDEYEAGHYKAGRQVMTCCAADIQYLSFSCDVSSLPEVPVRTWVHLRAEGKLSFDRYQQKYLCLQICSAEACPVPEHLVIGL